MSASPWRTADAAIIHISGGATTTNGRRKFSKRFLAKEVRDGRLKGARIGGRGELIFHVDWLDEYIESLTRPVMVTPARRRA